MFFDWVIGVLFRPGATFERSRHQLRLGYWWIVLTVLSLDTVVAIFEPRAGSPADWQQISLFMILWELVLFDAQGLLLLGAGRLLGWKLSWPEATKYTGLLWSVLVIEDIFTFLPSLRDMVQVELWTSAVFVVWYLIAAVIGLRKISGLPTWKAVSVALLATVPWRVGLLVWSWYALTH